MSDTSSELRQAWLLFSDLNTRFNILIDECAHLQETIYGFLEHGGSSVLGLNVLPDTVERGWIADPQRNERYYSLPARERALINLWISLGSLANGLQANQITARKRFEAVVQALQRHEGDRGDLYWFISLRGYFISEAFKFYTHQIEHAHEKLVQMLENTPGALPHPILLRRWNSAAYGEFLSVYSRHVNWQTQAAIWTLAHGVGGDSLHHFERWRSKNYLTHSWSHVPTSLARPHIFDRDYSLPNAGQEEGIRYFGTIRSAYFYLEQPILFPLLYHESAHINFRAADQKRETVTGTAGTFFTQRLEAAETLRRLANFDLPDEEFWNQFTEEVWADSIAVALCGKAYLAALVLQLFGLSGLRAFSQYDTQSDELIEISQLGTASREMREVAYPDQEDHYFWEARVTLACRLFRVLNKNLDAETDAWLSSIEGMLRAWHDSGAHVFAKEATSNEHQTFWNYRAKLNDWVVEVCDRCRMVKLSDLQAIRRIDQAYELDADDIRAAIADAVNNYKQKMFPLSIGHHKPFALASNCRLEDVSVSIRWHLSTEVARLIGTQGSEIADVTESYANYMRNDGSSAFRLGLEWCLARDGLFDAAADVLRNPDVAILEDSPQTKILKDAIEKDTRPFLVGRNADQVRDEIVAWIRRRKFATRMPYSGHVQYPLTETRAVISEALRDVVHYLGSFAQGGGQIRVGTLTLAVLRPWQMYSVDGKETYASALAKAKQYFEAGLHLLKRATSTFPQSGFDGRFYPLIGDYSYFSYLFGSTPVERDSHPIGSPKTVTKPRLVLQVFGRDTTPKPDVSKRLGRLSLLRFRYRWQWLDLVRKLEADPEFSDATLFLSSAWEDAVLVSWHADERSYWNSFTTLGTDIRVDAVDSQSSVIYKDVPHDYAQTLSEPEIRIWTADWVKGLLQTKFGGTDVARIVNERTGRYDYTVVWGDGRKACSVDRYMKIMETLPTEFWARIGSIANSFERQSRPAEGQFELVSHVLLRSG